MEDIFNEDANVEFPKHRFKKFIKGCCFRHYRKK